MKFDEIQNIIYEMRGQRVVSYIQLNNLYEFETWSLKQTVHLNIEGVAKSLYFNQFGRSLKTWACNIVY